MDKCICGSDEISLVHYGQIRDGKYPDTKSASIYECDVCTLQFLQKEFIQDITWYQGKAYRNHVGEHACVKAYRKDHDNEQTINLAVLDILGLDLRKKIVADIGCGAGLFLDRIANVAEECIAIEPCESYYSWLNNKYRYMDRSELASDDSTDIAVSFDVIEHVENPISFLKEIYRMLKPGGFVVIGTPNLNNFLMKICPYYKNYWYRTQHNYYFNWKSLEHYFEKAGFTVVSAIYKNYTTIEDIISCLRDATPESDFKYDYLDIVNHQLDYVLEANDMGDYIYMLGVK